MNTEIHNSQKSICTILTDEQSGYLELGVGDINGIW